LRATNAFVVLSVGAAAACGGDSDDKVESAPTTTEGPSEETAGTPPTTGAPVPLTKEQAAARYLEIVGPYNAAHAEAVNLDNAGQHKAACAMQRDGLRANVAADRATAWPADIAPLIEERAVLSDDTLVYLDQCANAPTDDEAQQILNDRLFSAEGDQNTQRTNALTNTIRTLLGLPTVTQ
jgi:hypothetical protein